MRNERRCSFLPAAWSCSELLIPAKQTMELSVACAMARDVTESSFLERSISTTSESSSRFEVFNKV